MPEYAHFLFDFGLDKVQVKNPSIYFFTIDIIKKSPNSGMY